MEALRALFLYQPKYKALFTSLYIKIIWDYQYEFQVVSCPFPCKLLVWGPSHTLNPLLCINHTYYKARLQLRKEQELQMNTLTLAILSFIMIFKETVTSYSSETMVHHWWIQELKICYTTPFTLEIPLYEFQSQK